MRLQTFAAACALVVIGTVSVSADEESQFTAKLNGLREVPSILTDGRGRFAATLDASGTVLSFSLTYATLSSTAVSAHVHFAQAGVPGNVIAFLCGGGGKPACPAAGGTVTGHDHRSGHQGPVPSHTEGRAGPSQDEVARV